jgi:hypothetical protein
MKRGRLFLVFAVLCSAGCDGLSGPFHTPWHAVMLPSGSTIKVTQFDLVWGAGHDDHALGGDCFAIQYVTAYPGASDKRRESEVAEVFELARPISEQWGLREATVAAVPTLEHRGLYDLYWFQRAPDGHWSSKAIVLNGEWIKDSLSAPPK